MMRFIVRNLTLFISLCLYLPLISLSGMEKSYIPVMGDIDKSVDGLNTASGPEIVLTTPSGAIIALKQDRALLNSSFPFYFPGSFVSSSPCLFDYDGNGELDIAVFTENASGQCAFKVITSKASNLFFIDNLSNNSITRPVISSFFTNQSSGTRELAYCGSDGRIYFYSLQSGLQISNYTFGSEHIDAIAAGRLGSGDTRSRIAGFTKERSFFILDPYSAIILFQDKMTTDLVGYPVVGDFNNDGVDEVAFLSSGGILTIVSGDMQSKSIDISLSAGGAWNGLTFGDFDNDGSTELMVSTAAGSFIQIRCLSDKLEVITPQLTPVALPYEDIAFLASGFISQAQTIYASGTAATIHSADLDKGSIWYSRWGQFSHVSTLMVFDGTDVKERYFSPNGDGVKDVASLGFFRVYTGTIGAQYVMTDVLTIFDASNKQVRKIVSRQGSGDTLGWAYFQWTGQDDLGHDCPEGKYTYTYSSQVASGGDGSFSIKGVLYLDKTRPKAEFSFSEMAFTSLTNAAGLKQNTLLSSVIVDNFSDVSINASIIDINNNVAVKDFKKDAILTNHSADFNSGNEAFIWDGTDNSGKSAPSGVYTYKILITDLAGNTAECFLTESARKEKGNFVVFNGAGIEIDQTTLFASPVLFHPSGTIRKLTTLNFTLNHRILGMVGSGLNDALYKVNARIEILSLSGEVVRKLFNSETAGMVDVRLSIPNLNNGNQFSVVWDGRKDDLSVASGGEYVFKIVIADYFGYSITNSFPVTIDDPYPRIENITLLSNGSYQIKGTAVNRRGFNSYSMFFRQKGTGTWLPLVVPKDRQSVNDSKYPFSNTSYLHVDGGELATWDVYGLNSGVYEIKVTVDGSDGSYSAIKEIEIQNSFSVRDFKADTLIVSPDGDGVQDTLKLSYLLPDTAQYQLEVKASNDMVVYSQVGNHQTSSNYPASFSLIWDGKRGDGTSLAGGPYAVSVRLNNGIKTITLLTNITLLGTNDNLSGPGFTNVSITSVAKTSSNGFHQYVRGIPYTWQATAQGIRTPKYRVDANVLATGRQMISRYPVATAVVEMGEVYNQIRVDRISWVLKFKTTHWFHPDEHVTKEKAIDYTNGFLVNKNTSFDSPSASDFVGTDIKGTPSQEDSFKIHIKASDEHDHFGPDHLADIRIESRKIESKNSLNKWVDITDFFDWNVGIKIIPVNTTDMIKDAAKDAGVAAASSIIGDLAGDTLLKGMKEVGTMLNMAGTGALDVAGGGISGNNSKEDNLRKFEIGLSIACQVIPKPLDTIVVASLTFIANIGFGDYSDEADITIPIKLRQSIDFNQITAFGFSTRMQQWQKKQISISATAGIVKVDYPGVHTSFSNYQGILGEKICLTNMFFYPFEFIPQKTKTTVQHLTEDIDRYSCKTNENRNSRYWSLRVDRNTSGDPVLYIRNNFHYLDEIPWPLLSRDQFYAYASDGVYQECLSNTPQSGILPLTADISANSNYVINTLATVSNRTFYLSKSVSNIQLY